MGNMDSAARPLGPVALGTVLGLLSVTELAIRLTSKSTVHAGLAAGPPAHAGVTLSTALLMCAFCLLATVPAGWLRPLPAALAVYAAALVSLVLFELVTIAGAAALLVTAYRLARSGSVVLAVALAAPFLGLALVLAGPAPRPDAVPVATSTAGLWAAGADTRVLTVMRRLRGVLREDAEQDKDTEPDTGTEPDLEPTGPGRPVAHRRPQPGLPQLGDLVDGAREASGSVVRLIMSGPVTRLDPGVELAAYRIVQEALTNARRHAPGAAVDVELCYAEDWLRLRIRDNGPGQTARSRTGHGLLGMRERAAAVGGALQAGDTRAGGFCVEAELPARAPDAVTGTAGRMHQ